MKIEENWIVNYILADCTFFDRVNVFSLSIMLLFIFDFWIVHMVRQLLLYSVCVETAAYAKL